MYKVILITGGSSGIGKAIGEFLIDKGYIVYATSRDSSKYPESKLKLLTMDVTNNDQINSCVNQIIDYEGRIDVLINNAGFCITGPLEEIPEEEIHKHFKTKDELITQLKNTIRKGDKILFKGSRGMAMETVIQGVFG